MHFLWSSGGKAPWRTGALPGDSKLDVRQTQHGNTVVPTQIYYDLPAGKTVHSSVLCDAQCLTVHSFSHVR